MAENQQQTGQQATEPTTGRRPGATPQIRWQRHESRAGSTYKTFLKNLCSLGNFDEAFAECAAVSVLCYLERRVMSDEARDLEAQLPLKLRELLQRCELHEGAPPEKYGREEFFELVARDLRVDPNQVEPIVRAVLTAVRAQVSEGEAEEFGNMLPQDLRELWIRPS